MSTLNDILSDRFMEMIAANNGRFVGTGAVAAETTNIVGEMLDSMQAEIDDLKQRLEERNES